jgi:hypothetical protein
MLPGYLHFDVRRGLSADMLNASLIRFLPDGDFLKDIFISLGLNEINFVVTENVFSGLKGNIVHFYFKDELISLAQKNLLLKISPHKNTPMWDKKKSQRIGLDCQNLNKPPTVYENDFLQSCLHGEAIHIKELKNIFLNKPIKSSIAALAIKILQELECLNFLEQKVNGKDALWLFCHLVMFSAQIDILDPKYISASKICIGEKKNIPIRSKELSVHNDVWLDHMLSMMPIIEVKESIEIDVLAVACIKALANHVGARGECRVLEIGIGRNSHTTNDTDFFIEALWCEAKLINSMKECGPSNSWQSTSVYEISALIPTHREISQLASMISLQGAVSISWHLVYEEKNITSYCMRFFCSDLEKRKLIEAFLIKGEARDVTVRIVERHELNRRLVCVPIGAGNKTSSIRFYEYIYYDKTVKVEPVKEDLDQYVEKTNYGIDVARGDLLLMWKKWRGRNTVEKA